MVRRKRGEVMIMKKKVLAEELIKVSKKFRRMFLEQSVADLGEVPSEPVGDEEPINVDAEQLGQEAYGDSVQSILQAIQDMGIENVEAEDVTTFVVEKDGKKVTFQIATIEGEPVVVIYNENGRVTVSLAPLIGYVTSAEDVVDKLANDDNAMKEFSALICDALGVEPGDETQEMDWDEEEFEEEDEEEEFEPEEFESDEEEEFEDEELEGKEEEEEEVTEAMLRRRRRGLRFREQEAGYDMASGRRDITIGLIQDSDEKIGSIPVKTIDITQGIEKKDVSGTEGMTFPNLYAFFQPKEGMPDVQGFVSGEVKQGEKKEEEE
jgi:hypothetical protein